MYAKKAINTATYAMPMILSYVVVLANSVVAINKNKTKI